MHSGGMSRPPRPLPASLDDAFTAGEALSSGVTRRRLRAADLDTPFRGVRMRREISPDLDDEPLALDRRARLAIISRAEAYARIAPEASFFVGLTAAAIHGLPLPVGAERRPLDVGILSPRHAPRGVAVTGVKVSPRLVQLTRVGGLLVADPASAWALAAEHLSARELVVWGDAIVTIPRDKVGHPQRERRIASPEHLHAAASVPWRRGRERLLGALDLIRVGSMSPLETEYRLAAASDGLPEPELDVEMRDAHGVLLGVCDAVYRAHRVIVEVEGRHHNTSDRQWNRDLDKYAALAAEGWEVVRLTSRHLRGSVPTGIRIVRAALRRHGWAGSAR